MPSLPCILKRFSYAAGVTSLVFMCLTCGQSGVWAQEAKLPPVIETSVERMNENGLSFFEVNAQSFVRATPQQVWKVLTDYERLTEFVPGLVRSKVLSRSQQEVTLEQESTADFLFLSQTIRLVVRLREQPFSTIEVALVSGDMKRYQARWTLAGLTQDGWDGTLVSYCGAIEPAFFLPPVVGKQLVKANVRKMVQAVMMEIEKHSMRE